LPDWLESNYTEAWRRLGAVAYSRLPSTDEQGLVRALVAVIAITKSQPCLARLAMLSESERHDLIEEAGWV
jgi:hypothetical protein